MIENGLVSCVTSQHKDGCVVAFKHHYVRFAIYTGLLVIHHQIRIMTVEKKNVKMQLRCCRSHKVASLEDDPRGNLIIENITGG